MSEYSPLQALSCMPRMCSSVDLPAPDGPMMETNSPGLMSIAMRLSTKLWPAPTGKDFSTARSDISGWLPVGSHGASVRADEDERLKSIVLGLGRSVRLQPGHLLIPVPHQCLGNSCDFTVVLFARGNWRPKNGRS